MIGIKDANYEALLMIVKNSGSEARCKNLRTQGQY